MTRGYFQFHTSQSFKVNTSRRYMSLELEIANIDYDYAGNVKDAADRWTDAIVEDGSLPSSGFEINSNPTNGDTFVRHITDLCDGLNDASAEVTRACGMHCHLDARDYSYFDLFKLTRLYGRIEDGLFSLCAPSRRNGGYSKLCSGLFTFSDYKTFKASLIDLLYGSHVREAYPNYEGKKKPQTGFNKARKRRTLAAFNEKYASARYSALNLHSFFYRRTVEFRHFQGTSNATKATHWAMVCASVMDAASRLTLAEIDALPLDSYEALLAVVPARLHAWCNVRRSRSSYTD